MTDDDTQLKAPFNVLFDTGALCANYISSNIYDKIKYIMNPVDITYKKTRIGLADNKTTILSESQIRLNLNIFDEDGSQVKYEGIFIVIPMKENEIIMGLPSIIKKPLWEFFTASIERSQMLLQLESESIDMLNAMLDLMEPWSNPVQTEAPEDLETPVPVQFEFASSFLGKPREEAEAEYFDMFYTQISEEFRAQTAVEELLRTKGLKVFIPDNWEGITGIDPLQLKFREGLPPSCKPKARNINPRLWEAAEKEFSRLRTYMYVKSRSPWASCLVVAPKATKPFIRFCGDYIWINQYIETGHYFIPNVRHELDKIMKYPIFLDIDLTNAFHQIRLHPDTAAKLSIQTPWGQYQPVFMPEGIGPGSFVLQETVRELFSDLEWAVTIFDNILIGCMSYQDAYEKLETFLDRCIQHNVVLKFSKSFLGFKEVKFFGYKVKQGSFELTDDRKEAILNIPFPESGNRPKKVRSLLGCGGFFIPFIKNYADLLKHLTDMTKAKFDWNEKTWRHNYRKEWEEYKRGLQESCALHYPDYDLVWVLRTDASDYGIGGVLFQIRIVDGKDVFEVIALFSKKFSDQALSWATIEKEAYAIFYGVKKFSYYLTGKEFIIETDHNNLRWMEASEVPKIIRWRIFLQSFVFMIRHIKGIQNTVADCLSRLLLLSTFIDCEDFEDMEVNHWLQRIRELRDDVVHRRPELMNMDEEPELNFEPEIPPLFENEILPPLQLTVDQEGALRMVHNSKDGHWGAFETWRRVNDLCPGHHISMDQCKSFVLHCACCQKTRLERKRRLIPIVRSLKPPHSRSAVGIDWLSITPIGPNGEDSILIVVNLFTKLSVLYPAVGCTSKNLAAAIWKYWTTYGHTDWVISDLGPDLNSQLFKELIQLIGMRHVFSIADKHSNGVERTCKETQRHLRAMVYDERIKDVFVDPTIIPSAQYILNSHVSKETGFSPFELTFGTQDKVYLDLFKNIKGDPTHSFLSKLNENLNYLRDASAKFQRDLDQKRVSETPLEKQNIYQSGDLVMFDNGKRPVPKLSAKLKGPYEVVSHQRNDVECRNIVTGALTKFSVVDLEPFNGTKDEAYEAALRDQDQYQVKRILSYSGDSKSRTKMTFKVEFEDGDIIDLVWTPDLQCEAYYDFCQSRPYLYHLSLDSTMAKRFITQKRKEDITSVEVGDRVFVDLRFFSDEWYESLELPDWETSSYVVVFEYTHWYHKKSKKKISAKFLLNGATYAMDTYLVYAWGSNRNFDPRTMTLVDDSFAQRYPDILA